MPPRIQKTLSIPDAIEQLKSMGIILRQVTRDELLEIRAQRIPSFVLKHNGNLYHSEIKKTLSANTFAFFGQHKCAHNDTICNYLSAKPDHLGGCAKVRAFRSRIEDFEFIQTGFETFAVNDECFVVLKCTNHKKHPPRENGPRHMATKLLRDYYDEFSFLKTYSKRT